MVQLFEDDLHGDEAVAILFDDVGLGLSDVVFDVQGLDMQRKTVASYQPHLIDIKQ